MRGIVRVCVRVWRYACVPGEDEQHQHVKIDTEAPGDYEHVWRYACVEMCVCACVCGGMRAHLEKTSSTSTLKTTPKLQIPGMMNM